MSARATMHPTKKIRRIGFPVLKIATLHRRTLVKRRIALTQRSHEKRAANQGKAAAFSDDLQYLREISISQNHSAADFAGESVLRRLLVGRE